MAILGHSAIILCKIYIEALLTNEELADQVWEAWDAGEIVGKQVRPPVPEIGGSVAYISMAQPS